MGEPADHIANNLPKGDGHEKMNFDFKTGKYSFNHDRPLSPQNINDILS